MKTPGTRLQWTTLDEWLDVWVTLTERHHHHVSAGTHRARGAHLLVLTPDVIEKGFPASLDDLERVLRDAKRRGDLRGAPFAMLFNAIDRGRNARRNRPQPPAMLAAPDAEAP